MDLQSNTLTSKLIKGAILVIVLYFVCETLIKMYSNINYYYDRKPWILKETKDARKRMVIEQDPKKEKSIQLLRSRNEEGGVEFSYSFWCYVDDWNYKFNDWKHILHKGSPNAWPMRSPGIWFMPKENKLYTSINIYTTDDDSGAQENGRMLNDIIIDNIPGNKWFHYVLAVTQERMDIYINGKLKASKKLKNIPKQSYGDLFINDNGGFSGYISGIRYFNYYVSHADIENLVYTNPGKMPVVNLSEKPPYFANDWWF